MFDVECFLWERWRLAGSFPACSPISETPDARPKLLKAVQRTFDPYPRFARHMSVNLGGGNILVTQ